MCGLQGAGRGQRACQQWPSVEPVRTTRRSTVLGRCWMGMSFVDGASAHAAPADRERVVDQGLVTADRGGGADPEAYERDAAG
jgi:hypothetical protein